MDVRSDTIVASLNWILKQIFDNAQQVGSGEFEVGTFFPVHRLCRSSGGFFPEIPKSGNMAFNVYEPFIYDGQKILIIDTPTGDATLVCHYSSKPELKYDAGTNNFYMLIKNNSGSDGFFLD